MEIRDKTYVLPTDEYISLLSSLFQKGLALDLVDVTGKRDGEIPPDERYIYDAADLALDRIDLDELFEKADELELKEKYSDFYNYLCSLQLVMEEPELKLEAEENEKGEELEEILEEEQEFTDAQKVLRNIVEGEHTGLERDSEVYRKGDEYREKLTEEYREKMIPVLDKDGSELVSSLHHGPTNAGDVTNVVHGDNEKHTIETSKEAKEILERKKRKEKEKKTDLQKERSDGHSPQDHSLQGRSLKEYQLSDQNVKKDPKDINEGYFKDPSKRLGESAPDGYTGFLRDSYEMAGQKDRDEMAMAAGIIAGVSKAAAEAETKEASADVKAAKASEGSHVIGSGFESNVNLTEKTNIASRDRKDITIEPNKGNSIKGKENHQANISHKVREEIQKKAEKEGILEARRIQKKEIGESPPIKDLSVVSPAGQTTVGEPDVETGKSPIIGAPNANSVDIHNKLPDANPAESPTASVDEPEIVFETPEGDTPFSPFITDDTGYKQDSYEQAGQVAQTRPDGQSDSGLPDFTPSFEGSVNLTEDKKNQNSKDKDNIIKPHMDRDNVVKAGMDKESVVSSERGDHVITSPGVVKSQKPSEQTESAAPVSKVREQIRRKAEKEKLIKARRFENKLKNNVEIKDETQKIEEAHRAETQRIEQQSKALEETVKTRQGYVKDSYEMANQTPVEDLKEYQPDAIKNPTFGFQSNVDNKSNENNFRNSTRVDVGLVGRKQGNQVVLPIGKRFTIRSDKTVIINGMVASVYEMNDSDVFVGWKNAYIYGGEIKTSSGYKFKAENDGEAIKGMPFKIHRKVDVKPSRDTTPTVSYSPLIMAPVTAYNFVQEGKIFSANIPRKTSGANIEELLQKNNITRTLDKQGKMLHIALSKAEIQELYNSNLSQDNIAIMVNNYDRILAVNCKNAQKMCKLNTYLESKYLSDEDRRALFDARQGVDNLGLPRNIDALKEKLNKGELNQDQTKAAAAYVDQYERTREKIIRDGILTHSEGKHGRIEHAFLAASMPVILQENGLTTDKNELKTLIKEGKLTEEQKKIAQNTLRMSHALNVLDHVQTFGKNMRHKLASGVQGAYGMARHFANKYISEDTTARGLFLSTGAVIAVVNAPIKAYKTVRKARNAIKNTGTAVKTTGRAAKATYGAARAGAKAVASGVSLVSRMGVKRASKVGAQKVRTKAKKVAKKATTNTGHKVAMATEKAAKTLVVVLVKILTTLASALFSLLGPMLLAVLFVIILIFGIFSFLHNSGETIYYDAGDENTAQVTQEMVDVLTLCHYSFRSALSNQFGGGSAGGSSASGTDGSALNAPQMQKGDSSQVSGLYNVTAGSWANFEVAWPYDFASGTRQDQLENMIKSGQISARNNGGLLFLNNQMYGAAFTTYWGNVGDVLKVEFEGSMAIGDQPATNTLYIVMMDIKDFKDTHYPEQQEGLYGHQVTDGGLRDFAEFLWWGGASRPNLNSSSLGAPLKATNVGNIIDGTCDLGTIGAGGGSSSTNANADILYRQEIDQDIYREIINNENNIYYTFPEDQEVPDGITPTPTPMGYDPETSEGVTYGFYNNNQELISMVLAMFDFNINNSTSEKRTLIMNQDYSGVGSITDEEALQKGLTNKINDDTWRLITYFDKNGLDLTSYTEGGYDDLKYSTLVGLFNASHIVTGTPVLQYHEGPDGTINPIYNDEGRIIGQNNTDGRSYQVPVMAEYSREVVGDDGNIYTETYIDYARDSSGEIIYETKYAPCMGHRKQSAAVITLHFDALLDLKSWWNTYIYSVEDFDKENPNYSSDDPEADNYRMRETTLKRTFQYIQKPDFYKPLPGTCDESSSGSSSGGFSPGSMTESQAEVCRKVYQYLTTKMGLTSEQAVGVLVNIKRECDFDYTLVEAGNGIGYGLCQWSFERRTRLVEWCNSHPNEGAYNTLEGQLSYLNAEFTVFLDVWTGNGPAGLKQCTTAREAGEYFIRYFERPASEYLNQRIAEMDGDIATVKATLGIS